MAEYEALPSQADRVWTPKSVNPQALGGSSALHPVFGYLCPPCNSSANEVGSVGVTSMERALLKYVGYRRLPLSAVELVALQGWAASRVAEPNATPWAHTADLESLRAEAAG